MARTHFIKCDQCEEPMLLQSEISKRTQSYRCHHCADRWAAVLLNSQGGVNRVLYKDGEEMTRYGAAAAAGKIIGELVFKKG